jgi:cellobiose phosphorylase
MSAGILGLHPEPAGLRLDPCLPSHWKGYSATRVFRGATYHIRVENPESRAKGLRELRVNGEKIDGNLLPVFPAGTRVDVWAKL